MLGVTICILLHVVLIVGFCLFAYTAIWVARRVSPPNLLSRIRMHEYRR